MSPPTGRVWARRLFLLSVALFWICVIVIGLEVWARLDERATRKNNPRVVEWMELLEQGASSEETLWDVESWSYRPNASIQHKIGDRVYDVRTNSLGWRSPEVELPKPEGVYRIVCVGGSTTVGGWTNETTYPAVLQEALRLRFPDHSIEVVNAGVSGLESFGESRKVKEYLKLQPDLIVEYNVVNDISRYLAPNWTKGHRWTQRIASKSTFVRTRLGGFLRPDPAAIDRDLTNFTLANLSNLGRAARAAGVPIAFASFAAPDLAKLNQTEIEFFDHDVRFVWGMHNHNLESYLQIVERYNALLQQMAQQSGFEYIAFAESFDPGPDGFLDICHLTTEAQRLKGELFAELLAPLIESEL